MKKNYCKNMRIDGEKLNELGNITASLEVPMSVVIRHWINENPIVNEETKKVLDRLKVIVRNTRSNTTQITRHLEQREVDENEIIGLKVYRRELKDVHWGVRKKLLLQKS